MNLEQYESALSDYLTAISLTPTQSDQIDTAVKTILSLIVGALPDVDPEAQGSYSTDTLVKPLTAKQNGGKAGEYDVDLALVGKYWSGARDSLDEVNDLLADDSTYGRMPIDNTKDTCVRIQYAEDQTEVAFHVDLVPTTVGAGGRTVAVRSEDKWKPSDARQFADWFNAKASSEPNLRSVAVILKRLRDLGGFSLKAKSILVLTLVGKHYTPAGSLMGDLLSVLDGIVRDLPAGASSRKIENPVNPGENLLDGMDNYDEVAGFFVHVRGTLMAAVSRDDADALAALFGPGFRYEASPKRQASALPVTPVRPTRAYGVSHVESDCR
jgi:hypothetical protein